MHRIIFVVKFAAVSKKEIENNLQKAYIPVVIIQAFIIGLKVIAEGVETKEQYDLLTKYRCDIIQGYYFSKPVPKEKVVKLLKSAHTLNL